MSLTDKFFFDIAIYRCTPELHQLEMEKEKNKLVESLCYSKEEAPVSYKNAIRGWEDRNWYPWRYNEVVGWIRLYIDGDSIKGEYYFIKMKRISKELRKKIYYWQGGAIEIHIELLDSSEDIFLKICNEIEELKKERPFKGRFIDMECFKSIGPYVNWKRLVK